MKHTFGLWVLGYLRFFARIQLRKFAPDIIGITGSAGKTSTRNAVVAVLKDKYRLKVTHKANSESGIPLDILGITPHDYSTGDWLRMMLLAPIKVITNWQAYDKYVVEMGIDSSKPPKNMEYLLSIIKPRTALFLNVLPVHTENFKSVAAIGAEKGKLIQSLPRDTGLAIVNADDPLAASSIPKTAAKVMTFGKSEAAGIRIKHVTPSLSGTTFTFAYAEDMALIRLPYLLAEHFGYTFAAALAVAVDEGMSLADGARLLEKNFSLPPGRMSLLKGVNGSMILDSSYNASAQPTIDAIHLTHSMPANRKLALLGDLRELGAAAAGEHERVILEAKKSMDKVYFVGPLMKQYGLPLFHDRPDQAVWCKTAYNAGKLLSRELTAGDLLLVKGSQNTLLLETAVEMLLHDQADVHNLCRRGSYWEKQRALLTQAG